MRPIHRSAVAVALPIAALLFAACFDDDLPTEQVGGTQFGLMLLPPSPLRVPTASFVATTPTGTPAQPTALSLLTVTLGNLTPLTGNAYYRFYAVGSTFGDAVPVAARLTALRTDSSVSATGAAVVTTDSSELGTSTFFRGAPANTIVRARFAGAQFGPTTRRFLVVTIQPDSTQPVLDSVTTARPVWLQFRAAAPSVNVVTSGSSFFGTFDPTAPYLFAGGGRGRSAFWDRFRNERLVYEAIAENLAQPPLGYAYQPWLRDTRTRRNVRFGQLVDQGGASLRDADLLQLPGFVKQIGTARFGTDEREVGEPLQSFDGVHLVIEPKLADSAFVSLNTVLLGTLGDTLGLRGLGAIALLVRQGGQAVAGATAFVVAEGSNRTVGDPPISTTRDSTRADPTGRGRATIVRIPSGLVTLTVLLPRGNTTLTRPVRVVQRDTVAVVVDLPEESRAVVQRGRPAGAGRPRSVVRGGERPFAGRVGSATGTVASRGAPLHH